MGLIECFYFSVPQRQGLLHFFSNRHWCMFTKLDHQPVERLALHSLPSANIFLNITFTFACIYKIFLCLFAFFCIFALISFAGQLVNLFKGEENNQLWGVFFFLDWILDLLDWGLCFIYPSLIYPKLSWEVYIN